jgi:hypothetical protein
LQWWAEGTIIPTGPTIFEDVGGGVPISHRIAISLQRYHWLRVATYGILQRTCGGVPISHRAVVICTAIIFVRQLYPLRACLHLSHLSFDVGSCVDRSKASVAKGVVDHRLYSQN